MKAYKIELICFDPNGDCDVDSMIYELKTQRYFCSGVNSVQSVEIGEWDDDHPINDWIARKEYVRNANWVEEEV